MDLFGIRTNRKRFETKKDRWSNDDGTHSWNRSGIFCFFFPYEKSSSMENDERIELNNSIFRQRHRRFSFHSITCEWIWGKSLVELFIVVRQFVTMRSWWFPSPIQFGSLFSIANFIRRNWCIDALMHWCNEER